MSQKRNDLCLCGSGKKYKKCCGAPPRIVPIQLAAERSCGECRKCCEGWLVGRVSEPGVVDHELKIGAPCPHSSTRGCGIYQHRPEQPCRSFVCGWLLPASPFPEQFKPDRLGVIVVPIQWREQRAWILVSAGKTPNDELLAWMREYSRATGEPHLIKRPGKLLCYGSVEFQQDMLDMEQRGLNPWNSPTHAP